MTDFYIPVKIVYFHLVTGSYSTASTIISLVWISQALMEVPTGVFSDLVGRKNTMILGIFSAIVGYIFYAIGHNYWMFIIGAFIEGISRAFFSGNNTAYLHNLLSEEGIEQEYHHYYGKWNSVMGIASFISSLLSGFLLYWSVSYFMWISIIPLTIALVISFFLAQPKKKEKNETNVYAHMKEAFSEIKGNINLRYISLSSIFHGGGIAAYEYQAAVYAAVWPTWAIGIARAVQEGGVVPSFWFAGKIIDRLGYIKVIGTSWTTSVLGNILAALTHSVFSPLFVMLSLPLYGAGDTAYQHLQQKEFTERQRATIASINSLGNSLYFSLVLFICGLIANNYGPFIALLATQIFILPSTYFDYKFLKNISKKKN